MGTASSVGQRHHLIYQGHVQGVGFRYTTRRIARGHELSGFVRNLPNGDVEVVAEGVEEHLEGFLQELDQRMSGQIRDVTCDHLPATHEFANFEIRY